MLGSAWDWIVGLLAVSPEGCSCNANNLKSGDDASPAWIEANWSNDADERAMVECILAEEDEDSSLDSLWVPEETGNELSEEDAVFSCTPDKGLHTPTLSGGGVCPCKGKRRGSPIWGETPKHRQAESQSAPSTWQQLAATALRLAGDAPPPPPLEYEGAPSTRKHRSKSIRQSLDSVVTQTAKEDESSGVPWQRAADSPKPEASPRSVFDGFCVGGPLLPPQMAADKGKRTLVLDLDETLVHSIFQPVSCADFTLKVKLEQGILDVFVLKRPGVDEFLSAMAAHYEVVIFTASVKEYADPLLDVLDPHRVLSHRLFRDSCSNSRNGYVKDLTRLGRSISDVIIVDNSPHAYALQPDNALPILSFYDDSSDCELQKISPFLESLGGVPGDVRGLLSDALGATVKNLLQARLSFLL